MISFLARDVPLAFSTDALGQVIRAATFHEGPMDEKPEAGSKVSPEEFKLRLQMETSLLVWVRTSLALMGFGFVVARFGLFLREIAQTGPAHIHPHPRLAAMNTITGTVLIALGVVVLLLSVWGHWRQLDRLERGDLRLSGRWSLGVVLCFLLAALGMGMAVYLSAIAV
jgi:putative membrane protein